MTVAGVDERVMRQIDEVIAWSLAQRSRVGYFAALYWHVATTLMRAVQAGRFTDPARIEQLNGVFFGRYLAALDGFRRGEPTTHAWAVAFAATERDDLLIVQHLLLGANAHIDLDLAIGVTETVPPDELPGFRPDFMRINGLLGSLIDGVCRDVTRAWPLLRLISHVARREDDWLLGFGLREARFSAWEKAERLAAATPAERPAMIARMDADAAAIGQQIASRAPLAKALVWLAALGQQRDVDVVIGDLLT